MASGRSPGRRVGPYWGNIDNFLWIWQSGSWSSGFSLPNDRNRGQTGEEIGKRRGTAKSIQFDHVSGVRVEVAWRLVEKQEDDP